jgi:hypothetical protein
MKILSYESIIFYILVNTKKIVLRKLYHKVMMEIFIYYMLEN